MSLRKILPRLEPRRFASATRNPCAPLMAVTLCFIPLLLLLAGWNPLLAQDSSQHAVGLRIIVVETSEEAQQVVKRLNQGEDFAAIATKESIDPSLDYSRFCWRKKKRCSKRLMNTGF
jgi:hypothetical protein